MYKNLGPKVSQLPEAVVPGGGQFTAEERSYEQVVFEFNKPIADWELNLMQEIHGISGQRLLAQKLIPSSFLTGDFLERPDVAGSYSFLAPDPPLATTANKFHMLAADLVVNGWMIRFEFTESATAGSNTLTLPDPPAGINTTRTDLIVLEVWRALLSPVPDVTNKSPTGQILRNGNAKAGDAFPPGNENLADDIVDPNFAASGFPETTRRVQIQYRYRVISGIDLNAYPDGLDSPALFANTVPYLGAPSVDGTPTAFNYVKSTKDAGLWTAGAGTPVSATTLGTVDGFIYAIPICAVFRRNSAAFDRFANLNGAGLMATGVSGRPDGLYADQIVAADVKDMRKGIAHDWTEVLEKATQSLFENSMSTQQEITTTGPAGTSVLVKDDICGGGHIGSSDGVRRYFSDRSVTETIVARVDIVGLSSAFNVDIFNLTLSWASGPTSLIALGPAGVNLVAVNSVRIVDTVALTDHNALGSAGIHVTSMAYSVAIGPGIDRVAVTLSAGVANVSIFVELVVEYPAGNGTSRNLLSAIDFWSSPFGPAWIDTTGWTATSDASRSSVPPTNTWWTDAGHRELAVHLKTTAQTGIFYTSGTDTLLVWERLNGDPITINDGVNAPYATTNYTFNTAYTKVTLTGAIAIPAGTAVTVTYKAYRALPPPGFPPFDTFQFFYQSRAVQSLQVPAGNQTLHLIPRAISKHLYVIVNGSGSPDSAFAFGSPDTQMPNALLFGESHLDTPNFVNTLGQEIQTGFAQFPTLYPYTPNPSQVTLFRSAPDTTIDADGRNFWPRSDDGLSAVYVPVALGLSLAARQKIRVALPVLMELKQDFASIGRKGTVVLVVFVRSIELDTDTIILMSPSPSDSCAGVYRVRGNLMNPRRTDV